MGHGARWPCTVILETKAAGQDTLEDTLMPKPVHDRHAGKHLIQQTSHPVLLGEPPSSSARARGTGGGEGGGGGGGVGGGGADTKEEE